MKLPNHPNQTLNVFLILTLFQTQQVSIAEDYSQFLTSCTEFVPCNNNSQSSAVDFNDNASCNFMDFIEPPFEITLPRCKNISFNSMAGTELVLQEDPWLQKYNEMVNTCYNLSPQLHNCNLTWLDHRLYAYEAPKLALQNCRTKELVALGDFYVLPDDKGAVGCKNTLGYQMDIESRCQFIELTSTEYEWLDDNTTLRLLPSNHTIRHAYHDSKSPSLSNITVCYPLSAKITKCIRDKLKPSEYRVESNRRIYNLRARKYRVFGDYLELGDYQIDVNTREVQICKDLETYTCMTPLILMYITSVICLILAITTHALIPGINHHAMPLLCQMFSMAVFYFAMFYLIMWHPETRIGSYVLFAIRYGASLATYFWLNVLSFDLWRGLANLTNSLQPQSNMTRYLMYSAYAFGIPLGLTTFCLILETHPSMQDLIGYYPNIGDNYWFRNFKSSVTFYGVPIAIQLCSNTIFFIRTIRKLKKEFELIETVNKECYKQFFSVFVKIFFTTGLSWVITESVPFFASGLIRYINGMVSACHGILIFIIYICKPHTYKIIRKEIKEKFCQRLASKREHRHPQAIDSPMSTRSSTITDSDISDRANSCEIDKKI